MDRVLVQGRTGAHCLWYIDTQAATLGTQHVPWLHRMQVEQDDVGVDRWAGLDGSSTPYSGISADTEHWSPSSKPLFVDGERPDTRFREGG